MKPKQEPCEDSPPPASDAAEGWETTPLSGNPFFTIVMSRTQVQKPFSLCMPARFHHRLPKARTATVLLCRGKSWTVNYCGDLKLKRFDMAWMDFAVDNRLRVGDACVFELMTGTGSEGNNKEGMTFQVQILRGGLPEEVTSKGATSDEPIVIVD